MTKHLALIAPDGTPEIHEEASEELARSRYPMLAVQADLNEMEGTPGYRAYRGETWPPEGYKLVKGKIAPVASE